MKYILQRSEDWGYWVATDQENKIVVKFKQGDYNGTAKATALNDSKIKVNEMATVMRELADWLRENYYVLLFDKHEYRVFIGQKIKELRESKGYSIEELAFRSDMQPGTITRIELGKYAVNIDALSAILTALDSQLNFKEL